MHVASFPGEALRKRSTGGNNCQSILAFCRYPIFAAGIRGYAKPSSLAIPDRRVMGRERSRGSDGTGKEKANAPRSDIS